MRTKITQLLKVAAAAMLVVLLTAVAGRTQPQGRSFMPDSARITAMVDELAKEVSLNKEQREKALAIYFASFADLSKQVEKNRGDFSAMRKIRSEVTEKRNKEIKALLKEDQKEKFDKFLKKQEEEMQKRRQQFRRNN